MDEFDFFDIGGFCLPAYLGAPGIIGIV